MFIYPIHQSILGDALPSAASPPIKSYHDLVVFQKARDLAVLTIRVTSNFPREDRYGLGSQMRNAATSIASNIAEGYRKFSTRDYIRFLKIAYGSCSELESRSLIVHDAGWIGEPDYLQMVSLQESISRMLWKMIESLQLKLRAQK